ncbi:MAG: molybdenum cofactor biosynthesis protein MoaE [Hyphomicrobium sp.]|nr:MAG: molybdenum cofactor biosynthesis protein MoaE [Hyphomicrobium sp.]PPD01930.1 MAG: molybdenum cofactor biosynthesis protein MoaE [Hyphomicrobium sp.]
MSVTIQTADFDTSAEIDSATKDNLGIGAVATFIGKVRGEVDGRPLQSMTLEHYPGMTETELTTIAKAAYERFQLSTVRIVHRVGELTPGNNIVLVIATAPHRQDAFDGCAFLMDYLKTRAPFWKKEVTKDGKGQWVDARQSDDVARDRWDEPQQR